MYDTTNASHTPPPRVACVLCMLVALVLTRSVPADEASAFPSFRAIEIDPDAGTGLAIAVADVNGDSRLDIVAVSSRDVAWYENPSWKRRLIADTIRGSNVCIAPHDLDGDGLPEFALGADWQFNNTRSGGSLHLLWRGSSLDEPWRVVDLLTEPTLHRIRWADTEGDGSPELIVAPLKGRHSTGPRFSETGVRLLLLRPPSRPLTEPWPVEVFDESLHVLHNIWPTDWTGEGRDSILAASFEGITRFTRLGNGTWRRQILVPGNPEPQPASGAGEIKLGRIAPDLPAIATVEPWHGHQAVVYVPASSVDHPVEAEHWRRFVIDDAMAEGHALGWADFDADGADELLVGFRGKAPPKDLPGLNIFDFDLTMEDSGPVITWTKHVLDEGGMATEDALAADFNGDGRPDVVAFGRATHNVKLYENLAPASAQKP